MPNYEPDDIPKYLVVINKKKADPNKVDEAMDCNESCTNK